MWIVKKVRAEMKAIAIVCAGGIGGRRDGDTLVGSAYRPWPGKLGDDPAVRDMVIEDDRVAAAAVLAAPPKPDQIVVIPRVPGPTPQLSY